MNSLLDRSDSVDTGSDQITSQSTMSGYLYKKSSSGNWQRRYFETNGSHLTYYKTHKMTKLLAALSMPQVGSIKLVTDTVDSESQATGVVFQIDLKDRQLQLRAATYEEANKWINVLISLRDGHLRESGTFLPDAMTNSRKNESSKSDSTSPGGYSDSKKPSAVLWKTGRFTPSSWCAPCCSYLAVSRNNLS